MSELGIVLLCIGGVLLIVGIAFIFPYRVVSGLSSTTKGVIKDITYNAYAYNERVAGKFATEKNAGSSDKPGIRVSAGVGGYNNSGSNPKQMYHTIYSYMVDGVEYSRAAGPGYNKGIVEKKIGTEVTVYYDPADPLKSSLSSGTVYKILSCSFIPVGAILVIVGFILM